MSLQTPSRNVVIARNTSMMDELIIQANSSVVRLGQQVNFIWDIGVSDRPSIKPRSVLLEAFMGIDALEPTSSYRFAFLYQFIESFEILVNDTTVHETVSSDVPHSRFYVNRLLKHEPNDQVYQTMFGDDMADHIGQYDPYVTGFTKSLNISGADPVATTGAGYLVSNHLERFFDGILNQIPLHRIRKIEIRLRMIPNANESKFSFSVDPALTDATRLTQLPVFRNMRLKIRYERFATPQADPIPSSLPLILHTPRYEVKRYNAPFAGTNRVIRVNLKTEFSPNKMIHAVWLVPNGFDRARVNGINTSEVNGWSDYVHWPTALRKFEFIVNGNVKESYEGETEIKALYNRQLVHEHGHPNYLHAYKPATGLFVSNLATSTSMFYYSFSGIREKPLSNDVARRTLIVSGKPNDLDNYELQFTFNDTYLTYDHYNGAPSNAIATIRDVSVSVVESSTVAELYVDGSAKVSGR